MKRLNRIAIISLICCLSEFTFSQDSDSLGVIGDNLDLYAVLDAFKEAVSIETFEKTINDPENKINNLDLNEDDEVDYIQVHDEGEGDAHAFVLRVDMGEDESQDIAVIELEKSGDNQATIQIIGDEDIYGTDYIIEPEENGTITERLMIPNFVVVNVWGWPSVRFVFGPKYVRWHSPWRWGQYPGWWKPWKPYRWNVYHGFHAHRHPHYHVVTVRRCTVAHGHYVVHRRTCVRVKQHRHYRVYHHQPVKGPNKSQQPNKGVQKKGYDSSRRNGSSSPNHNQGSNKRR